MEEVVGAVKKVTDIMAEIASAAQEQSSGIEQVNQAVTQMDQVTQQNAALVEQAAAAADSMQQQAQTLSRAVAIFKLEQSGVRTAETAHVLDDTPAEEADAELHVEPKLDETVRHERRGPNRAKNVARLPVREAQSAEAIASVKSGTDDDWTAF
jgi:methyl-accepting chemotaxis protein